VGAAVEEEDEGWPGTMLLMFFSQMTACVFVTRKSMRLTKKQQMEDWRRMMKAEGVSDMAETRVRGFKLLERGSEHEVSDMGGFGNRDAS